MRRAKASCAGVALLLGACDAPDAATRAVPSARIAAEASSAAPSEPPPAPKPPPPLGASETIVLYERLSGVFGVHADAKCQELAAALDSFVQDNAQRFARVGTDVVASLERDAPNAERFRKAMEPVMTGSMRCKDEPRLRTVIERLDGARTAPR